jgi:hypothetical protein
MSPRNYGLFSKTTVNGKTRWMRVPGTAAYPRKAAVRIFQDRLINSAFSGSPLSLRPVLSEAKPSEIPAEHVLCSQCEAHLHDACLGKPCSCACKLFIPSNR